MDTLTPIVASQQVDRRFTGIRRDRYLSSEAQRTASVGSDREVAGGGVEVSVVDEESASGRNELAHLFERARRALASRLRMDPQIAEAFALLRSDPAASPPGSSNNALAFDLRPLQAHLTAHLVIDARTHRVVVRVVDRQTQKTVREFGPATLVAAATRIGHAVGAGRRG